MVRYSATLTLVQRVAVRIVEAGLLELGLDFGVVFFDLLGLRRQAKSLAFLPRVQDWLNEPIDLPRLRFYHEDD